MRALSDALPTGHRAMANPTLQLHFGCGRATPPVSHSHNWPSGRMKVFLFKIGQKKLFFANKDPKNNFDNWMILQKHVLSFKCNDFFKMANLKAISSSATLSVCSVSCYCVLMNKIAPFTLMSPSNTSTSTGKKKVSASPEFWLILILILRTHQNALSGISMLNTKILKNYLYQMTNLIQASWG